VKEKENRVILTFMEITVFGGTPLPYIYQITPPYMILLQL
jgi:hypothetical protein